ncbi:unnamed protein product [Fusarium fujikuroi]|nr:unnamed protein product [Fusarium fujikuroi]
MHTHAQSSLQATTAQQIQFYDYWIYGKSIHNEKIETNGRFSADSIPDRIAILYLFMPIIRTELSEFVYIWNLHYIRKQRNRPHVLPEIRETRSYARPILFDRLRPLKELFKYDNIDLDAYLPQDTITLSIYLYLRARLEAYILSGEQPAIGLLETPIGGINRVRSYLAAYDIDV